MKNIEIKIEIEGKKVSTDLKYSDEVTLNEFAHLLDALKSNYVNAIQVYCEDNKIPVAEYVRRYNERIF